MCKEVFGLKVAEKSMYLAEIEFVSFYRNKFAGYPNVLENA